jgi:hypothetical protein
LSHGKWNAEEEQCNNSENQLHVVREAIRAVVEAKDQIGTTRDSILPMFKEPRSAEARTSNAVKQPRFDGQ